MNIETSGVPTAELELAEVQVDNPADVFNAALGRFPYLEAFLKPPSKIPEESPYSLIPSLFENTSKDEKKRAEAIAVWANPLALAVPEYLATPQSLPGALEAKSGGTKKQYDLLWVHLRQGFEMGLLESIYKMKIFDDPKDRHAEIRDIVRQQISEYQSTAPNTLKENENFWTELQSKWTVAYCLNALHMPPSFLSAEEKISFLHLLDDEYCNNPEIDYSPLLKKLSSEDLEKLQHRIHPNVHANLQQLIANPELEPDILKTIISDEVEYSAGEQYAFLLQNILLYIAADPKIAAENEFFIEYILQDMDYQYLCQVLGQPLQTIYEWKIASYGEGWLSNGSRISNITQSKYERAQKQKESRIVVQPTSHYTDVISRNQLALAELEPLVELARLRNEVIPLRQIAEEHTTLIAEVNRLRQENENFRKKRDLQRTRLELRATKQELTRSLRREDQWKNRYMELNELWNSPAYKNLGVSRERPNKEVMDDAETNYTQEMFALLKDTRIKPEDRRLNLQMLAESFVTIGLMHPVKEMNLYEALHAVYLEQNLTEEDDPLVARLMLMRLPKQRAAFQQELLRIQEKNGGNDKTKIGQAVNYLLGFIQAINEAISDKASS